MNQKKSISYIQPIWNEAQNVSSDDLTSEQQYSNNVFSSIITNQIGSGVLSQSLNNKILFDSSLVVGFLDGKKNEAHAQPTDTNFGNLLEIELINSNVAGKKTVKICIIGLDFNSNIQYETFVFKINEKQYTKKHYTNILAIFFNDLIGPTTQSFNLGGRVIIKEASNFSVSRDIVMASQDTEPNLFFRDFFTENNVSLNLLLTSSLPLYNIDNLNIKIGYKENKILEKNDVNTQIGQKFLATTNNIQKITLLLSVQNSDPGMASDLEWHGDLVVSIYPLQSTVNCITDLVPNLAVDFPPDNIPLAQISINFSSLQSQGIVLDGTPQPVDFVFSNTLIAGNKIIPNSYYAITVKRSGSADKCDILITAGSNTSSNARFTTFTGTTWVDIPEDSLWFKIYTDAIKVTDGQAYDENGQGISINKTKLDINTGASVDNIYDKLYFNGGDTYSAILSSNIEKSEIIQDQRTGDDIYSRQMYIPEIKLLNSVDTNSLKNVSEPLIIGQAIDKNRKFLDSVNTTLTAKFHNWSFINNKIFIKIIDDITDPRYDADVNSLISSLLNGDLVNAKIIPNTGTPTVFYRISDAKICSMKYGDVNGDGIIDNDDLTALNNLIGSNLNSSPPLNSQITTDGYTTTVVNGYNTYVKSFKTDSITFQIVNTLTNSVVASGTDGYLVPDPNDPSLANLQSISTNFNLISNIVDRALVIYNSLNAENNGSFDIVSVFSSNIISIKKSYYNSNIIKQILRADIDNNFIVNSTDGYLLTNYINRATPFPSNTLPSSRIGTSFNVLELTVESFTYSDVPLNLTIDRNDDFGATTLNRATVLHPTQDIFKTDGYLQSHNFYISPITFNIVKQLSWEDYLVLANGNGRLIPTIFSEQSGALSNSCQIDGINCELYSDQSAFDPGVINIFAPNDLTLNGDLKRPNGDFYKVDFEIGNIILQITDGYFNAEKTINIFDNFIAEYNNTGLTRFGFKAMRFADCSFVEHDALIKNQVRFSVSVQSFSPNLKLTSPDGYVSRIGTSIDNSTGILSLYFNNLYEDAVLKTLSTKIQITVYLKKAGFNNTPILIDSTKTSNLLQINSLFTGAGSGNAARTLNPLYINGLTGVSTVSTSASTVIGVLTLNLHDIVPGYTQIFLEVILETASAISPAVLTLFDLTSSSLIKLDSVNDYLLTTSTSPILIRSIDLSSSLQQGNQDFIYQLEMSNGGGSTAVKCKLARFVVLY